MYETDTKTSQSHIPITIYFCCAPLTQLHRVWF